MSKDSKTEAVPVAVSPLKNFLAGGFGGMCLVFAGHPFDTIKVRLQTMVKGATAGASSPSGQLSYAGAFDAFRTTFRTEGITGFYKGMGTPLTMTTPLFAMAFFGYGMGKKVVSYVSSSPGSTALLSPTQLFCAGAISGSFTSLVVTPVERIKCLLQIQTQDGSSAKKYKGPINCGSTLIKEGGISGLYRGFGATIMRSLPQSGLYFMTYDVLKRYFNKRDGTEVLSTGKTLLAGGLTGIINWTLVLPLDVIKSRVQTAAEGSYPRGVRDALPQLLRAEGVRGLFRGIVPVFMRAFPANAACFMGFETALKFLNWAGPNL